MKNQSDREKHEGDFADKRLTRNPFGFLQVANPPSAEDLEKYYADRYYQTEQAWYRKEYPPEETAYFNIKIEQRAHRAKQFLQKRKGCFLDVGCGEGFALDWFAKDGWDVEGVDYSKAGIERNPHSGKILSYVMPADKVVDIDTPEDLARAELLFRLMESE